MKTLFLFSLVVASPFFSSSNKPNVRATPIGKFKGTTNGKVQKYLGIPYAQPPIGPLRFKKPVPLPPNPNVEIDATKYGNACIQVSAPNPVLSFLSSTSQPTFSEDCLNLDVYVPEGAKDLPVMVWNFPGGYEAGDSQGLGTYNGERILSRFPNAIIVSFNARVGVFGFLASEVLEKEGSLNPGFYDTELVFKWVRQNIRAFGVG